MLQIRSALRGRLVMVLSEGGRSAVLTLSNLPLFPKNGVICFKEEAKGGLPVMPSTVLCSGGRLVRSRQMLAALKVCSVRTFSTANPDEPYIAVSHADSGPRTVWPDENMGPFGPQDQRFQLPGNVGFDSHLEGVEEKRKTIGDRVVPDVLTAPCSAERHQFILAQFVNEFQGKLGPLSKRVHKAEQYFNQTDTDCSINSCPELLRKDLELLFPTAPNTSITVVTVSQRSGRLEETQPDKEQMLSRFVSGAKEMCFALWTAGYWADFIDPATGEAFFASPVSPSVRQTGEEEPRHSGFRIEMSGTCTVIRHILRGTPLFVGTVFTNAPTHSAIITRLQGLSPELDDEVE